MRRGSAEEKDGALRGDASILFLPLVGVVALILGFGLGGCQPRQIPQTPLESRTPSSTIAALKTIPAPTVTPRRTALEVNEIEATPLTPQPVPATATRVMQLCSPLAWETIPELFEIVSDPYHPPPPNRAEERHHGVDFSHYSRKGHPSIEGEPVQAILDGKVVAVISDRLPYGNMVIIETPLEQLPAAIIEEIGGSVGQSLYILYAHLAAPPSLEIGAAVACGEEIGAVGKSGLNIVNPHLHLETRLGASGGTFRSMAFYAADASQEEMDNYLRWRTSGEYLHFDPLSFLQAYLDWVAENPPPPE